MQEIIFNCTINFKKDDNGLAKQMKELLAIDDSDYFISYSKKYIAFHCHCNMRGISNAKDYVKMLYHRLDFFVEHLHTEYGIKDAIATFKTIDSIVPENNDELLFIRFKG